MWDRTDDRSDYSLHGEMVHGPALSPSAGRRADAVQRQHGLRGGAGFEIMDLPLRALAELPRNSPAPTLGEE